MFHLKANQQKQQQHSPETASNSSILEQLIGQVATGQRGQKPSRAGCSIQRRLADQSNRFKRHLDRLHWASLKSDLQKSLGSFVQSGGGLKDRLGASGVAGGGASTHNVLAAGPQRRDENSRQSAPVVVAARPPYGCRLGLRRTASLGQRKSAAPTATPTKPKLAATMKPVAGLKVLAERNGWASRSMRAGSRCDRSSGGSRSIVGGLLGGTRSKPVSRRSSARRSTRSITPMKKFVSGPFAHFLMILVMLVALVPRSLVEMAPIWPAASSLNWPGAEPAGMSPTPVRVTSLFGVPLDDDIAQELNERLAKIYDANPSWQPDWKEPQEEAQQKTSISEMVAPPNRPGRDEQAGEYLWIERRRLNRDRVLEPPAWLRTRPIRGSARQLLAAADNVNGDNDIDEDTVQQAIRPVARRNSDNNNNNRNNRQSRDSSQAGLYDEVLEQLISGSLDAGRLLEELQGELEERARSRDRPQLQDGQLLSGLGASQQESASVQQQQQQQQHQHQHQPQRQEKQQQKTAALAGANQAEQLIVAGDEISDPDDTTLVPVIISPMGQQEQQPAEANQAPGLASFGQITPVGETQEGNNKQKVVGGGDFVLVSPLVLQSNRPISIDRQLSAARQLMTDTEAAAAAVPTTSATIGKLVSGGAPNGSGRETASVVELIPIAGQLDQGQPAPAEDSFHVLEDIDQIDGGRETLAVPAAGGATAIPDIESRLALRKRSLDRPAWSKQTLGRPDSPPSASSYELDPSDPSAGSQWLASDRMAAAIKLIAADFFSRNELLEIATELKYHLEHALNLPRGSIRALFPINRRQILVKLERGLLNAVDRFNLAQEFGYSDSTSSITLDLGDRLHMETSNPLPLLAVILDKINGYQETDSATITTGQRDARRGEPRATPLEERGGAVQINEPHIGRALALRTSAANEDELGSDNEDGNIGGGGGGDDDDDDEGELVDGPDELASDADSELEDRRGRQLEPASLNSAALHRLLIAPASSFVWLQPAQTMSPPSWLPAAPWGQPAQLQILATPFGPSTGSGGPSSSLAPESSWRLPIGGGPRARARPASLTSATYGNRPSRRLLAETLERLSDDQLGELAMRLAAIQGVFLQPVAPESAGSPTSGRQTAPQTAGYATRILERIGLGNASHKSPDQNHLNTTYWLISICILIGIILLIMLTRLIMRRLDKVVNSSRRLSNLSSFSCSTVSSKARLWAPFGGSKRGPSPASCTASAQEEGGCGVIRGEHASCASRAADLQRAPQHKRGLSADSGLETIDGTGACESGNSPERLRKSLDLLAARLARFMSFARSQDQDLGGAKLGGELGTDTTATTSSTTTTATNQNSGDGSQEPEQRFRTSTSYIRSLIEALTKAANVQVASSGSKGGDLEAKRGNEEDDDDEDDDDNVGDAENEHDVGQAEVDGFDGSGPNLIRRGGGRRRTSSTSQQQQQQQQARSLFVEDQEEVLMSQMDISAAHLILDYMERHLVDKEMLRREWQELNVTSCSSSSTAGKAQRLVLQRLARVALQEANLAQNRNPDVVPFDRNRVKLGRPKRGAQQSGGESARSDGSEWPSKPASRRPSGANNQPDYINASFIYDDDPRRPTHIIAQGPTEATCGQFWQMIWEQEVSLIVMLTRLNENGSQMCHCYWPTSVAQQQQHGSGGVTSGGGKPASPPPPTQSATAAARRGSVTSVFNGSKPIVAGAIEGAEHTCNNVLRFELAHYKLEVQLISEHVTSGDYLVRNMYLMNRNTGETRSISQFHYLAWLHMGTPDNVRSFLQFRRKVHKSYRNSNSPILVHCSDGAGRSGTYTLVDMILERIRRGAKEIDLRATLEHLRDQRPALCSSQEQFEFALVALAEEIQIILNALPH